MSNWGHMTQRFPPSHYLKVMQDTGIKSFVLNPPISSFAGTGIFFSPAQKFAAIIWSSFELKMNSPATANIDLYSVASSSCDEKLLTTIENCCTSILFSDDLRYFAYLKWLKPIYEARLIVIDLTTMKQKAYINKIYNVITLVNCSPSGVTLINDPLVSNIVEDIAISDMVEIP